MGVAALQFVATPALAAAGDLDSTFGTGGKVVTTWSAGVSSRANAVTVLSGGKILVAGQAGNQFAVARYKSNGALDTTWGGTGKVATTFPAGYGKASAIAQQPDGKILVAGLTGGDFALIRYKSNGGLDTTFGVGGKVTTDFGSGTQPSGSEFEQARAIVIQPDGKIIAAGNSYTALVAARYLPDGSLDSTFGSGGKAFAPMRGLAEGYAAAVQADGKILLAGSSAPCVGGDALCIGLSLSNPLGLVVARFTAAGIPDATFGTNGSIYQNFSSTTPMVAAAASVSVLASGKILVAGRTSTDTGGAAGLVTRLNADGSRDTTFGTNGLALVQGNSLAYLNGMAVLGDGRIVVGGFNKADGFAPADFLAARLTATGAMDTTYGNGGVAVTDFGGPNDEGNAVAIPASGGKVTVTGFTGGSSGTNIAMARYKA
jgi:uncharacterized delta-60 repeat protein